ncbi:MAG: DUF5009 domain-containing protein, partial [Calditrichia bacterium]
GVLQRIAVVYGITAVITMNTNVKTQAWLTAGLLLLYWGLMKLVPVPGHGAGVITPEGNLAAFIDQHLFAGHMWGQTKTWDPEGFLSTIPAVCTGLSGVLTGHWLNSGRNRSEIAGWMFVAGWIAIVVGLFWGIVFPINKSLWTSSYVVFTTGAALQFLAFCYWLIDVKDIRKWAKPAIMYGMNAIAIFTLSILVAKAFIYIRWIGEDGNRIALQTWVYRNLFVTWASEINASLVFAILNVLFFLLIAAIMYRKKIFIKI